MLITIYQNISTNVTEDIPIGFTVRNEGTNSMDNDKIFLWSLGVDLFRKFPIVQVDDVITKEAIKAEDLSESLHLGPVHLAVNVSMNG